MTDSEKYPDLRLGPGSNIALKIPDHLFEQTLEFYRRVVNLTATGGRVAFQYGENSKQTLWLDRVRETAKSDVWLELRTGNLDSARRYFLDEGITIADQLEPLPHGYQGFWIVNPGGIVHLVSAYGQ